MPIFAPRAEPVSLKAMEADWEQNKKTECIGVFHSTPFCDSPQPTHSIIRLTTENAHIQSQKRGGIV